MKECVYLGSGFANNLQVNCRKTIRQSSIFTTVLVRPRPIIEC